MSNELGVVQRVEKLELGGQGGGARLWGLTVYRVETGGGWAKVYKSNRHGWVSAGCGE